MISLWHTLGWLGVSLRHRGFKRGLTGARAQFDVNCGAENFSRSDGSTAARQIPHPLCRQRGLRSADPDKKYSDRRRRYRGFECGRKRSRRRHANGVRILQHHSSYCGRQGWHRPHARSVRAPICPMQARLRDAGSPCPWPCGLRAPSSRRRFAPGGRCGRHARRSCLPRPTSRASPEWHGSSPD